MNVHDQPTLADLRSEFAKGGNTQLRVEKKGEIKAKVSADSGKVLAALSGRADKFKKAEALVESAYKESCGVEPSEEVKTQIQAGVRGKDGQTLAELFDSLELSAISQTQDPELLSRQADSLMAKSNELSYGKELCTGVDQLPITPEAKQKLHLAFAEAAVKKECEQLSGGNTLLRGNNAAAGYMSEYMKVHAKAYSEAVMAVGARDLPNVSLPTVAGEPATMENMPRVGKVEGRQGQVLSSTEQDGWLKAYEKGGQVMVDALQSEECLKEMTQETKEFLGTISDSAQKYGPAAGGGERAKTAFVSTVSLRGAYAVAGAGFGTQRVQTNDAAEKATLNFALNSVQVAQSYMNAATLPPDAALDHAKETNIVADRLRTDENLAKTNAFTQSFSGEGHSQQQGTRLRSSTRESLFGNGAKAEGIDDSKGLSTIKPGNTGKLAAKLGDKIAATQGSVKDHVEIGNGKSGKKQSHSVG
jgi:hypothetical protein